MSSKPGFLRRFFGALGSFITFTRNVVLNLIFLFLVLLVLSAVFSAPRIEVPDGSALVLDPSGVIVEQESYVDPLANLLGGPLSVATVGETRLRDILEALRLGAQDPRIRALVLRLDQLQDDGGFSKLQEIGAAIEAFKTSGKKVYALGDTYTQGQYYLAAFADEILLHDMGGVDLEGFGAWQPFFGEAIDKLGVNMHVFRVGEYKSAVEPFERNDMSNEAREANLDWLEDLWQMYLAGVSGQRGISPLVIENSINNLDAELAVYQGNLAQFALGLGLVDRLGSRSDMRGHLAAEIGDDGRGGFRQIDFRNYLAERHGSRPLLPEGDSVGVIVASGLIYDGEQVPGNIGGDTLAGLIHQARDDEAVKAVVLRLDTGGGSAFASEVIRDALLELREAGKPLVVSMSSVAASGGYWISAPADQIWASPATLTGSIGIFAIFPTFQETLARLGIRVDGVGTTALSGALVLGNELPPVAVNAIQLMLEDGYRRFLNVVAEGRDMSIAQVEAIAQGRVWSGQQAIELGLVDRLGSLDDAVASAAALAGVEDFQVEYIERELTPAERLLRRISESLGLARVTPALNGDASALLRSMAGDVERLVRLNDPRGVYLQCLECKLLL